MASNPKDETQSTRYTNEDIHALLSERCAGRFDAVPGIDHSIFLLQDDYKQKKSSRATSDAEIDFGSIDTPPPHKHGAISIHIGGSGNNEIWFGGEADEELLTLDWAVIVKQHKKFSFFSHTVEPSTMMTSADSELSHATCFFQGLMLIPWSPITTSWIIS